MPMHHPHLAGGNRAKRLAGCCCSSKQDEAQQQAESVFGHVVKVWKSPEIHPGLSSPYHTKVNIFCFKSHTFQHTFT